MKNENIKKMLEDLFYAISPSLSPRCVLNKDDYDFLINNDNFKDEIKKIRKNFKIPELLPEDDIEGHFLSDNNGGEVSVVGQRWFDGQSMKIKEKIKNGIETILIKYQLSPIFYDWILFYLLYRKIKWKPFYDFEILLKFIENPEIFRKVGLSTQEKKFIKERVRIFLKYEKIGRPSNDEKKIIFWKTVLQELNSCKSIRRRWRTKETSFSTLEVGKIIDDNFIDGDNGSIVLKKRYKDLSEKDDKNEVKKEVQRLRKQKERFMKKLKK